MSVFSGTPKARYNLVEAFSFLNYSRKLQLIKLMEDLGELPVYYCGDEEMYMRCADMQDGKVLCALFNLGLDPIEQVIISTENEISSVHRLMPDGCFCELEFSSNHNEHTINSSCNTLDPLILVLTK